MGIAARGQIGVALCLDVVSLLEQRPPAGSKDLIDFLLCPEIEGTFGLGSHQIQAVSILSDCSLSVLAC